MSGDVLAFLLVMFILGAGNTWVAVRLMRRRKPKREAHFHSLGHGVRFPCNDERCPERTEP